MAAALHTLVRNPIPNHNLCRKGSTLPRVPYSPPSGALTVRRLDPSRTFPWRGCLVSADRRILRLIPLAAQHEESKHSDVEVEKEKTEIEVEADIEIDADESQEARKQDLESFKEEALKLKGMSQEAYEVYSKKAMVILQETSEKLQVQVEKAMQDLSILAKEISEEGKEYLTSVAKNSPDEVKDVVETFASVDELKHLSDIRDFHIGIPYGAFLSVGGFLSFMLTGSIPAIRFGIILGTTLLTLSILSLRLWKSGKPSPLLLKGQAAISGILFIREWRLFFQRQSFSTFLSVLISGAVLALYIYRILMNGHSKGPSLEQGSKE